MDYPLVGLLFPPTRHQQTICVQAKTNGVRYPPVFSREKYTFLDLA